MSHNEFAQLSVSLPIYQDYVVGEVCAWRRAGFGTALLTLVEINGSSPRPLGSQIAVREDGLAVGAISGGCAERALVLDALTAIRRGRNHIELYGEGSRFKDIVLPCGSGIYVAFDVTVSDDTLENINNDCHRRQSAIYSIDVQDRRYERLYLPRPRLAILGSGTIVPILAQFAKTAEFDTVVYSPDADTRLATEDIVHVEGLLSAQSVETLPIDDRTAIVSLFHDHDFEVECLKAFLKSPAFYIGALGSKATHAQRLERLIGLGNAPEALKRINGPIGLTIGAKTPPEIAIAIMAQVIEQFRAITPVTNLVEITTGRADACLNRAVL